MFNIKYSISILILCVLIIPLILSFVFNWYVGIDKEIQISIYGLYMIIYLLLQITFATLNTKRLKPIEKKNGELINLLVIGYKEKEEYFKLCLEGVKIVLQNTKNLNKVYVIIDGNEEDDLYMIDIYKTIFDSNDIHYLQDFQNDTELCEIIDKNAKVMCINKKHSGKRDSLYTGFRLSLIEKNLYKKNIDSICCTDSDTILADDSLIHMHELIQNNVSGVVGNLGIFNKFDSILAFLTSIRYFFAFNLERAYQSFNGCVLCVSGPIGMYKTDSISKIIEDWRNQTFLGSPCTYGDDRHLTNCILNLGENVVYTPKSIANTETPSDITRFFKQQTRWSKSSFREIYWNIKSIDKQSQIMIIDLVYTIIYPFVVMGYLQYILWSGTIFDVGVYFSILSLIGLVKSIYGFIISKNPETLLYYLYGIVYITLVFPAKIWGLLTIKDISWGTSKNNKNPEEYTWIPIVVLWNTSLVGGITWNLYKSIINETKIYDYILIICIIAIMYISLGSIWIYSSIKRINREKKKA